MATREATKAYNAGKASLSIIWPDDASDEQRSPGMHHCPFAPGDPMRTQWARGLSDALGGAQFDPATIRKEIADELQGADDAR